MDAIDLEFHEINKLERQFNQLISISFVIKDHGMNPTAGRLLSTVGVVGLESFTTEIALESVFSKLKETAAQWSAKILSFVKSSMAKLSSLFLSTFKKIRESSKKIKDVGIHKLTETKEIVKAHPYKTMALVLASIGAAIALVAYATNKFPKTSKDTSQFVKGFKETASKINSPFYDIDVSDSLAVKVTKKTVEKTSGTLSDLGYTDSTISSLLGSTDTMMNHMNSSWSGFTTKSSDAAKHMQSGINSLIGREDFVESSILTESAIFILTWEVIKSIYYILKTIVIIGFMTIATLFKLIGLANTGYHHIY